MKSKLIQKSMSELMDFVQKYEQGAGFKIGSKGIEYLQKAKVRAFYSDDDRLLGGYAISTIEMNPSLRYFDLLGDLRDRMLARSKVFTNLKDIAEITFTFFTKEATRQQRMAMLIYPLYEVWRLGKKMVLGGGIVKQFCDRMKPVLTKVFFDGEVDIYGNRKHYTILYEERKNLIKNFLKALMPELRKLLFGKRKR